MSTSKQLDGDLPSWFNKDTNSDHYTTNFGSVEINKDTREVGDVSIGLGRNQGNTQMSIYIYDAEYKVTRDTFGSVYAQFCSPNAKFPYTGQNVKQNIEVIDILKMLQKDDNHSVAAIAAKKEFIKLLCRYHKFSKQEAYELHLLLAIWRKPITKEDLKPDIKRTPIVTRTPIFL